MIVILYLNSRQYNDICSKLAIAIPLNKEDLFPKWSATSLGIIGSPWFSEWTYSKHNNQKHRIIRAIKFQFSSESELMLFKMLMM